MPWQLAPASCAPRDSSPVYPVRVAPSPLPMTDADGAPRSTVLDETHKVAITRFDERIRVGGMAGCLASIWRSAPNVTTPWPWWWGSLFEGGRSFQRRVLDRTAPLRRRTAPLVGPAPSPGLWLNTGHGTLGWTMAVAGSGRHFQRSHLGQRRHRDEGLTLARFWPKLCQASQVSGEVQALPSRGLVRAGTSRAGMQTQADPASSLAVAISCSLQRRCVAAALPVSLPLVALLGPSAVR